MWMQEDDENDLDQAAIAELINKFNSNGGTDSPSGKIEKGESNSQTSTLKALLNEPVCSDLESEESKESKKQNLLLFDTSETGEKYRGSNNNHHIQNELLKNKFEYALDEYEIQNHINEIELLLKSFEKMGENDALTTDVKCVSPSQCDKDSFFFDIDSKEIYLDSGEEDIPELFDPIAYRLEILKSITKKGKTQKFTNSRNSEIELSPQLQQLQRELLLFHDEFAIKK